MPKIEYRIQATHLSTAQCDNIATSYRQYFKYIVGAACTFPNVGLSTPLPYEIKGIDGIQEVAQISTLINCINNKGLLGRIMTIRMKQY